MAKSKNQSIESNYYQYFELTKDPFPVDSFDNVLFLTPELTSRLEEIKNRVNETDKLILITSVPGAGKSTISDYLESIPEKNWKVSLVQAVTGMDRDTLAHEIIQQVSPDKADEKSFAIPQLHKFLEFSSKTEKVPVFIIDDAHKLSTEILEFILELSALKYQETSFRFVLFADENINDRLNTESLADLNKQLVTRLTLPSLSKIQLKEYIDNRLSSSGDLSEYPFSDEDFQNIYNISAGLPKGINILSRQIMELRSSPTPSRLMSPRMIAGVTITFIISIVLYLTFIDDISTPSENQQPVVIANPPNRITPGPISRIAPALALPPTSEIAQTSITDSENITDNNQVEVESGQSLSINTDITTPEDQINLSENHVIKEPVVESLFAADQQEIIDPESSETSITENEVAIEADVTENYVTDSVDVAKEVINQEIYNPVSSASNYTQIQQLNIYKLDDIPDKISGIKGEVWFKDQPQNFYSLQLISASEISNVLTMLEGLDEFHEEMSGYVKYTPSGRPRYLLFFGLYPDKESAVRASTTSVPDKLKTIDPYPRTIGGIIKEIEEVGYWPR
ncbi:MAG: type II secretory pathway predicted ATPase ExeA/septal ring-binding cell division protein DamX [Gammaproteobacteria bacterium]|jgi:type II secretory pathway predicted ATPase ExeA/septal ring-binding cell division protein DamX